ncbi:MAG: nucleoside-diphosphate sugar epimerase/dehydratase [Cyclobacteriaceae bacterium]
MIEFTKKINIVPRWIIACLDGSILFGSAIFAFFLRVNFDWSSMESLGVFRGAVVYLLTGITVMFFTKSYVGIVRHTGLKDGMLLLRTIAISGIAIGILNIFVANVMGGTHILPFSVLIIASVLSLFLLIIYRLLVKDIFRKIKGNTKNLPERRVLIYGAGEAGSLTHQAIQKDSQFRFFTLGYLDDDPSKKGKKINGKPVYGGLDQLDALVETFEIKELIIAILDLHPSRKREIIDKCIALDVHALTIPPVNHWVEGGIHSEAIREVNIEDLLGRDSISLKNERVAEYISGKAVLVTGAAGSIGSELCIQIARANPSFLIMLDRAESPLHDHEIRLCHQFEGLMVHSVLGDVTEEKTLEKIFRDYMPEVIFHAAAYKHVPMMEKYPTEAIKCNVLGTKLLADLAVHFGVEKFVLVSTDKAVNPTNVMGASKRLAEMYVQSLDADLGHPNGQNTKFITTRFGNVLGSNGSVIPLFKEQIRNGGPLTVTDPEVTRFFMTIPEACELVLEAGVMGNGGEIFVFDMGEPIKIIDLAKKMIYLSGKKLDTDIKIRFTGLRQGEKLYEEVLNEAEIALETHHEKIKIAQVCPGFYEKVNSGILELQQLMERESEMTLVAHIKKMVPEYISKVSRFEVLDKQKLVK